MIQRMSKLQIVGSKSILPKVIEVLHTIGTIQIESIPKKISLEERFITPFPLDRKRVLLQERLDALHARIKDILLLLPKPVVPGERSKERFLLLDITSDEVQSTVDDLYDEIKKVQTGVLPSFQL